MKTDVIEISPTGEGMAEALRQTEKAAAFQNLNPKQGLRLRLLAEEMMGMLRTLVGKGQASYWVEAEGNQGYLRAAERTGRRRRLPRGIRILLCGCDQL